MKQNNKMSDTDINSRNFGLKMGKIDVCYTSIIPYNFVCQTDYYFIKLAYKITIEKQKEEF